jgi:tripartite-type tricarboxylate transporter receptor subunit TctC
MLDISAARCVLGSAVLGLAVALSSTSAQAEYPERPVNLIVPYAAGGGTDMVARAMTPALEAELGVTVNVVNRPGGTGILGHQVIANADPDGYTLGFITNELLMWHWQGLTDLTYEDFTPLAQFTAIPSAVIVRYDAPYPGVESLLDEIKASPGELKASGTMVWQMGMLGMLRTAGIETDAVAWVPAQGGAPAIQDVAAGGVDFATANASEAQPLVETRKVRTIAVMADERIEAFPEIPTLEEAAGLDWSFGVWHGVAGPKGLPQGVKDVLMAALKKAHEDPQFREILARRGISAVWKPSAEFATFMAEKDPEMAGLIQAAGLAR